MCFDWHLNQVEVVIVLWLQRVRDNKDLDVAYRDQEFFLKKPWPHGHDTMVDIMIQQNLELQYFEFDTKEVVAKFFLRSNFA